MTSQLIGLSFDAASSPSISLRPGAIAIADAAPTGWGFAWYPADELAAAVITDPYPDGDSALSKVIQDWERFRACTFVCHVRGVENRVSKADAQPFERCLGRRSWVFAHSGDLRHDFRERLPLGDDPVFEPVGVTDSEHALCWLLAECRRRGARTLAEIGWPELHALLREIDACGTAAMLLSDGQDLVAYRDAGGLRELHVVRRIPPHDATVLTSDELELRLDDPLDLNRSMVLVSSRALAGAPWQTIAPGHMLVARRGTVSWRSVPEPSRVSSDASPMAGRASVEVTSAPAIAASPEASPARGARIELGHVQSAVASNAAAVANRGPQPASRILRVVHHTRYRYQSPVEHSTHLLRLEPTEDHLQQLLDYEFEIEPNRVLRGFEDVFGNRAKRVRIDSPYSELHIVARSRVRVHRPPPLSSPSRRSTIPLVWMPWQRQMMLPYLLPPELPESQLTELSEFAMSFAERQDYNLLGTLRDINATLYRDLRYVSGSTSLETTPFDVYVDRRGVCQDFANLFICLARLLGVPARYRVGYIHTGAEYANQVQSEASHAWVELYLPWLGWRGFDPTNGCEAGLDHIRVAVGRNYRDATPTSGTIYKGGAGESLEVQVMVEVEPRGEGQPEPAAPAG